MGVGLVLNFLVAVWIQSSAACADAPDCRRQATEAAARGEYEQAHDLAWRALQKGKPNDPESMLVLARAQSLSGRPGDALVMLGRVAALGLRPDVASDPDFRRVRDQPGWPELAAKLTGAPLVPVAASGPAAPATLAPRASAAPSGSIAADEGFGFTAPGVEPFALAHDAVSRRFVLGDRAAHRLLVVDEVSHNVVNYVSAASAGFYDELTAFTIDPRRGDLWVASARGEGTGSASVLHKLQLVSGRSLAEMRAPEKAGAVRFVAVTVAPDGVVFALDAIGSRLFRARPGGKAMEEVMKINAEQPSSLAVADAGTVYVGGATGIVRIDPSARTSSRVRSADDLGAFQALAWRAGSLVGVERLSGASRVVRIPLDASGTRAQGRQVLADAIAASAGTLAGDSYYYLSDAGTIRRVLLTK
jgi:hypothetical protein